MRLSLKNVEALCAKAGLSISGLLDEAGVSRNTFYTLARKEAVVPQSLLRIAERLDVSVSALLVDRLPPGQQLKKLIGECDRICRERDGLDPDNVRHTLILLQETPVERLRRALRRGRQTHLR